MESQASLDTYRSLRSGMVAAGLLLGAGLVAYILGSGQGIPPSISATFYTPLSTIFVSSLVAVGLALVAVKGRRGLENTLLDVAGSLIPVVAFVPTPLQDPTCPVAGHECVPPALHAAVDINIRAYLAVGLLALLAAWIRMSIAARTPTPWTLSSRRGLIPVAAVWVVFVTVYLAARNLFLQYAHYTGAISFFLLLGVVVWINGRRSLGTNDLANLPASWYRGVYKTIGTSMLVAILGGVVMFLVTGTQNAVVDGSAGRFPVIFWIEVIELLLFVIYWVVQTVELWFYTEPPQQA